MPGQWSQGLLRCDWDCFFSTFFEEADGWLFFLIGKWGLASARSKADGTGFCKALCCRTMCCNYTAIREKYNIEGNALIDCAIVTFCTTCAISQAKNEVKKREGEENENLVTEQPKSSKKKNKTRKKGQK